MNENERKRLIVQIKSSKPTFAAMEAVVKVIEKELEKQKHRTIFLIPCSLSFFIGILVAIGVVRDITTGMLLSKDLGVMF